MAKLEVFVNRRTKRYPHFGHSIEDAYLMKLIGQADDKNKGLLKEIHKVGINQKIRPSRHERYYSTQECSNRGIIFDYDKRRNNSKKIQYIWKRRTSVEKVQYVKEF